MLNVHLAGFVDIRPAGLVLICLVADAKGVRGDGMVKLDMQFLADVYIPCESCQVCDTIGKLWRLGFEVVISQRF